MNVFDFLNDKLRKNSEFITICHSYIHPLSAACNADSTADIPVASRSKSKNLNVQVMEDSIVMITAPPPSLPLSL